MLWSGGVTGGSVVRCYLRIFGKDGSSIVRSRANLEIPLLHQDSERERMLNPVQQRLDQNKNLPQSSTPVNPTDWHWQQGRAMLASGRWEEGATFLRGILKSEQLTGKMRHTEENIEAASLYRHQYAHIYNRAHTKHKAHKAHTRKSHTALKAHTKHTAHTT